MATAGEAWGCGWTSVCTGYSNGVVDGGGWIELFAGFGASFWISTNPALTFVFFERIRAWIKRWWGLSQNKAYDNEAAETSEARKRKVDLGAGFVAKALTTVLTFPILKLQAVSMVQGSSDRYITDLLRTAIRERGLGSLYTGLLPKLLQASLQQALIFRFKEDWHPKVSTTLAAMSTKRG